MSQCASAVKKNATLSVSNMTPDERWYEAVKHMKKASELLDTKLEQVTIIDSKGVGKRRISITYIDPVEQTEQEEG